jgi:hypothetical protein
VRPIAGVAEGDRRAVGRAKWTIRSPIGEVLIDALVLNPAPIDVRPCVHGLAIDASVTTASTETALEVASAFGIAKVAEAQSMAREVGTVSGLRARTPRGGGARSRVKVVEEEVEQVHEGVGQVEEEVEPVERGGSRSRGAVE